MRQFNPVRYVFAVLVLLLTMLAPASDAAELRMDITYTNGRIVSGPLSADLTELPESVLATFVFTGPSAGDYDLADVSQASLDFGDAAWRVGDLQNFATTVALIQGAFLAVNAVSYEFGPVDTPTVSGRLSSNFPLDIQGTDLASGLPFHYQYDMSAQMITVVPEPSSIALAALAFVWMTGTNRLGRGTNQC